MTLDEIKTDLKHRLDLARVTYSEEMKLDHQDVRTKESAWGKMVAYAHALKLLNLLK